MRCVFSVVVQVRIKQRLHRPYRPHRKPARGE
jgi:hypothetical protein